MPKSCSIYLKPDHFRKLMPTLSKGKQEIKIWKQYIQTFTKIPIQINYYKWTHFAIMCKRLNLIDYLGYPINALHNMVHFIPLS